MRPSGDLEERRLYAVDLAKALKQTQSFVTKSEVGDRRLDVIQLRTICRLLGTTLPDFIEALEQRIEGRGRTKQR